MQCIYQTRVMNSGKMVSVLLVERMIILFKDNAPEELADYIASYIMKISFLISFRNRMYW